MSESTAAEDDEGREGKSGNGPARNANKQKLGVSCANTSHVMLP